MTRFRKMIPFPLYIFSREITKNTKFSRWRENQSRIGDIKIYRIYFNQNSDEYDLFYFDSLINNFLTTVKNIFVPITNGTRYSRIDQEKLVENSLYKIWKDMVCLSTPYHVKRFEGCLPQILLGPFLNILTQMIRQKSNVVSTRRHSSQ